MKQIAPWAPALAASLLSGASTADAAVWSWGCIGKLGKGDDQGRAAVEPRGTL